MNTPDYKKITQVLNYIAQKFGGQVNYMKALKLLYLADRLHLRKYGRLITDDMLVAMKNGTLGSQAKDIVMQNENLPYVVYEYSEDKLKRDLENFTIESNFEVRDNLSETDIECIDNVISALGEKKGFDLAELTHSLPEWKRHQFTIETKEKKVVPLTLTDLFQPSENTELNKIYSQSVDELDLSKTLFLESLEQDKYLV
jgi:uncharacterized phage-associated protein